MEIIFSKYDAAKYPFLPIAREYVKELGYDLNEFNESNSYILDKSLKRILLALDNKPSKELGEPDEEIISFLISLLILNILDIRSVSKRFALAEAERIENFIENDLKDENERRRESILRYIFENTLGLKIIEDSMQKYKIKVAEYLRRSVNLHDPHWRLINKDVYEGYVHLEIHDIVRLIREEIALLIYEKIEKMNVKDIPESIKNRVEILRRYTINDKRFKPIIIVNKYPPCINHILSTLEKNDNVSHTARFLLATYMLAIGKSIDDTCSLFEHAPDYNEKITRYQVEFLAGKRGNRKSYNCPSCEKIASMNLCYKNEECDNIRTPLQFGMKRNG
ncbi:MAG: hypothetical protein QXK74_04245 [Candidatus Nitrosocaldaceae archaeon]